MSTPGGFCHECKTTLIYHADGSVLCSCDGVDSEDISLDQLPHGWSGVTADAIKEWRDVEAEA